MYNFRPEIIHTTAYINIRNGRINIIHGSIRSDGEEPFLRRHDSSSPCNNTASRSNYIQEYPMLGCKINKRKIQSNMGGYLDIFKYIRINISVEEA